MQRNVLLDIANTLCQMLYSRHLEPDRELLLSLPAGLITVNLLNADATHSTTGPISVNFARVFSTWLTKRCIVERIPLPCLTSATLYIEIDPSLPHPTDFLGPFDRWSPRCIIDSDGRTYTGELRELGVFRPMF